jgi:flagellar protein FlbD
MIFLTRMDKQQTFLNPDHIVSIEETPDTVITLFNGHHLLVCERAAVIIDRIVAFRARVQRRAQAATGRKYLDRTRRRLFRSLTLNRGDVLPLDKKGQISTPLHTQDF